MAPDPLLAGVDAGTSRIRALIFTTDGQVVAEGSRPTPIARPRPGWAEHDPEALWQAACGALRDALAQLQEPERVVGIAAASVGEALVTLDAAGQPTGPTIAWYDERPKPELDRLLQTFGAETLYALTGLSADPTFSLLKLLWLQANDPDALARTNMVLNLTHYLAWRLSGVPGSDLTQASRTLALDLQKHAWAEDFVREVGLSPGLLAPIRPCGARLGTVTAEAAKATGLGTHCTVGVGGHDHIVGALAVGALDPGVLLNSLGTAEALTLALDDPSQDIELGRRGFNQGVVEVETPVHYVFGGFATSGACIEWFRSLFAADLSHEVLIGEADLVQPCSHGVTFLPDLRGRISPVPDPLARGAWFGLAADNSRAELYRAVLEGLAFEARQTVDALTELPEIPAIRNIRAIGGNTRNELLMRIKASIYGQPIVAAEMAEATALGAALLGGLAARVFPNFPSALNDLQAPVREITPVGEWVERYAAQYRSVYQPAYAALRPLHHAGHALDAGC